MDGNVLIEAMKRKRDYLFMTQGIEKTLEMVEDMVDSDSKFTLLRLCNEKLKGES